MSPPTETLFFRGVVTHHHPDGPRLPPPGSGRDLGGARVAPPPEVRIGAAAGAERLQQTHLELRRLQREVVLYRMRHVQMYTSTRTTTYH